MLVDVPSSYVLKNTFTEHMAPLPKQAAEELFTAEDNAEYLDTSLEYDGGFNVLRHYLAACLKPSIQDIRTLVEAMPDSVDTDELCDRGWSILNLAAFNAQLPVDAFKFLIDSGARVDIGLCNIEQLVEYHVRAGPYAMTMFPKIMVLIDSGVDTYSLSENLKGFVAAAQQM